MNLGQIKKHKEEIEAYRENRKARKEAIDNLKRMGIWIETELNKNEKEYEKMMNPYPEQLTDEDMKK